ncbi:hypothetical protein V5D56_18435 [Cellulosimicrobium sp. PMB13]|uniref:hypothetical protein n=1 Tax=Cellulosimicrobium sp. PMB13 TaxID=3120158 RepID=UPI003F4AFB00
MIVYAKRRRLPLPFKGARFLGVPLTAAVVVIVAAGVLLRLRDVSFLPWLGDMGAYVNWANELVRTGSLDASWPPLFSAYLAVPSFLFGPEHAASAVLFAGVLLLVAVPRLLLALGVNRWFAVAALAAVAVSPHAVWYSSFTASESLAAPLFVLWLVLLLKILGTPGDDVPLTTVLGLLFLAMCLLRGSAPLLMLPLLAVWLLTLLVPSFRASRRSAWLVVAGATTAASVSYAYGISQIHGYYVDMQLTEMLPGRVWERLSAAGLFDLTPQTYACLVLVPALFWAVGRWMRPAELTGATPRLRVALGAALSILWLALVAWMASKAGDVSAILGRMGWAGVLIAGLAPLASAFRSARVQLVVVVAALSSLQFLVLHDHRLGGQRAHTFFLYWDRYLVSELLPTLYVFVFATVGWGAAYLVSSRRRPGTANADLSDHTGALTTSGLRTEGGWRLPAIAAVTAVAVAAPGLSAIPPIMRGTTLEGSFELIQALDDVGDADAPVVWSANGPGVPEGHFFPNTRMAFARPLEYTFGRDVLNDPAAGDFDPDEVASAASLDRYAACSGNRTLTVIEADAGGTDLDARLADSDLAASHLAEVSGVVELLHQPASSGWIDVDYTFDVWTVEITGEPTLAPADCDS